MKYHLFIDVFHFIGQAKGKDDVLYKKPDVKVKEGLEAVILSIVKTKDKGNYRKPKVYYTSNGKEVFNTIIDKKCFINGNNGQSKNKRSV
jgi:hypothetical protein